MQARRVVIVALHAGALAGDDACRTRKARADILAEKAVRRGEHQAAQAGAGAAAAGVGDALHRQRRLLGGKRILLQPLGRDFGGVEQVEVADGLGQAVPDRRGPGTGSSGETFAIATARSASPSGSDAAVAETLATRLPTKTRSEISSLSDDSVLSTLPSRTETPVERPRTATASAASAPALSGGFDQSGDAVDKLGASERWSIIARVLPGCRDGDFVARPWRTIYCSNPACAMGRRHSRLIETRDREGTLNVAVEGSIYSEMLLLLGGAVVAAPLFKRIGLGTILGYLAAGVAIGPVARLITGGEAILHVAELGIVFLLFIIGLELKPSRLWGLRRADLRPRPGAGAGHRGAARAGRAWPCSGWRCLPRWSSASGWRCRRRPLRCRSSNRTARAMPSLGQTAFSILLFQDLAIVPLLALIPLLAPAPAGAPSPILPQLGDRARSHCRAGARRPLSAQPAVPDHRQYRRQGGDDRGRAAGRARRRRR